MLAAGQISHGHAGSDRHPGPRRARRGGRRG
jgi:hypothetical protein